jgi:Tol biopolymer transport system component
MKPGKCRGKSVPRSQKFKLFAPFFLVLFVLSLALLPLPALGGNAQTQRNKALGLSDDWVKGDGTHYLGLNPPAPGNTNLKMLPALPQEKLLSLPTSVDLSSQLPPVGDQGAQASCVGWATCYYLKSWLEKQEHTSWSLTDPTHQFSPAFTYNQIADAAGGTYIHKALYYLANQGDVDIAEMPYDAADHDTMPTAAQFEAAKPYRNSDDWGCFFNHEVQGPYATPNNVENLKAWLAAGRMFVIGIPFYGDFPDYSGNAAAPYYDYNGTATLKGGHAVCVCGYNNSANPSGADADHRGGFKVVNSWGPGWNGTSAGYVYLSYDFMKNYVWEAWAAHDKTGDSPSISSLSATAGNVGDTIHIYGRNFGTLRRNAKVTLNGVAATTVGFTNEDITVTVPSVASTGPIAVYDWEGTPSNQLAFTVGVTSPILTSAAPFYATQNTTIATTLTGSNFISGCTARLQKDATVINASSVTFVSSTQVNCSFSLAGATAGAYDVVVKNSSGPEGRLHNGFQVQPTNPNIVNCSVPYFSTGYPSCERPSISADGRYVAFYSTARLIPDAYYSIWRKDLQTGEIRYCDCDATGNWVPGSEDDYAAISADGRYVAFASSTSLSPSGAPLTQIYLKDMQTGALTCCSTNASGTQGDDWSIGPVVSSDGRYVAFRSQATNLVANDTNGFIDIFRKDLQTGAVICCSTDAAGNLSNGDSGSGGEYPAITADGRYVVFETGASNLVPWDINWWGDIFRKDCVTGEVRICSVDVNGNLDWNYHESPSISSDGRYVAFIANGWTTLVPGADNCQVVRKDLQTGEVLSCSADVYGNATSYQVKCPAISGDGRYVSFATNANDLVPGEVESLSMYIPGSSYSWDVFRKDLVTGELVCCGTNALGNWENEPCYELGGLSISADGRYTAFIGVATNLVPYNYPEKGSYVFRKDCSAINVPRVSGVSPSSAKSGETITITGSGFGSTRGTSKVELGMMEPASYTSWSDTQIKCVVPSNVTGDVLLRVVTSAGVSNLKTFKITLYPAPTVSSITPNSANQNTTVNITNLAGTNFVSGAAVHLQQGTNVINASNPTVVSANQITCSLNLTNAAAGAYDVVVINPDGQTAKLTGGFTVNAVSPCGAGAISASFTFGIVMGLLSLAGSGGLLRRSRRKRK